MAFAVPIFSEGFGIGYIVRDIVPHYLLNQWRSTKTPSTMKHVSARNQKHVIVETSNKKTFVLWTKQKKI